MKPQTSPKGKLVLGWKPFDPTDPQLKPRASPENFSEDDLVCVPALSLDKHTAIVAQSGSGKSFFLGRFIEELLIRTKARCIILDPNGDFLRFDAISKRRELWAQPVYDPDTQMARFTHDTLDEFEPVWSDVTKRIRTTPAFTATESLRLPWSAVSADLLASAIDPLLQDEVRNCHLMVQSFLELLPGRLNTTHLPCNSADVLAEVQDLLSNRQAGGQLRGYLTRKYKPQELASREAFHLPKEKPSEWFIAVAKERLDAAVEQIVRLKAYTSPASIRFYFGRALAFTGTNVFTVDSSGTTSLVDNRLEVVDLSSVAGHARKLVISAIVEEERAKASRAWRHQLQNYDEEDRRVPFFLVVDEAHNLMPAEPADAAARLVLDQFRTIAAEGRKYGVFLIIVSQRPDKLDRMIVSECENKVVMRLGSENVLNRTRDLLGLEDVPSNQLAMCLEFPVGRGILVGAWADGAAQLFFAAARRTEEGGKSLDRHHWTTPYVTKQSTRRVKHKARFAGPERPMKRKRPVKRKKI